MPQRRGKGNNKKKKGKGGQGKSKGPSHPQQVHHRSPLAGVGSNSIRNNGNALEGELPQEWREKNFRNNLHDNYPTIYSKYKIATKRFLDYMITMNHQRGEATENNTSLNFGVNSLLVVSDWMAETQQPINKSVLRDLKLAIRIRYKVANSIYGGGDAGHKHFLAILQYCYSVLKDLVAVEAEETKKPALDLKQQNASVQDSSTEEDNGVAVGENRFSALMEEEEEEEEEDTSSSALFPPVATRPDPVDPETQAMTLEDLMNSDDRNDAIIFLLTLNELMKSISDQYQMVVKNYHDYTRVGAPGSSIIEPLLEAAVATNMAIQQVQQLEMELMVQHPHLSTPYRLLATLVLPEMTQQLTETVRKHSQMVSKKCKEQDITSYLGDCIECYCRNKSDRFNQSDTIAHDFCDKWQVDATGRAEVQEMFMGLEQITRLEIPMGPEKQMNQRIERLYQNITGLQSHSWIRNMPFIGGDRAIHHTLRLLQAFGSVVYDTPQDQGIIAKRGFFGPTPWRPALTNKTRDLDELLMSDIMPQWVLMCRHGVWNGKYKLPRQDEICPLFVALQNYVDRPEKAVSWSTTFAVHAILTSILETVRLTDTLGAIGKTVFDNYFRNVGWKKEIAKKSPSGDSLSNQSPSWQHNTNMVLFLKNLGLPVFGQRAMWNPLCSGTIFSYLEYVGNLEAGCTLIDCHAQLRIVLHLYNALLVTGIIRTGELPVLDMLHKAFGNSKAIWEGIPPSRRGEFVQRFWICFGHSIANAKIMAEKARQDIQSRQHLNQADNNTTSNRTRQMSHIDPAQISKSFRRICNRDFHDVEDKYHTPEQRRRNRGSDQYHFAVRSNDTLDAVDHEQKLLSFNLPATGAVLDQFVSSLGRVLQWEPILTNGSIAMMMEPGGGGIENNKRQGFAYLFAQYILGAMDFADDPFSYQFLGVPMGEAPASFMTTFFSKLDPGKVLWFQAVEEETE